MLVPSYIILLLIPSHCKNVLPLIDRVQFFLLGKCMLSLIYDYSLFRTSVLLFVDFALVLTILSNLILKETGNNTCGESHWHAARNTLKKKKRLDETGLTITGCRHGIAQQAVNMFYGEVYGYAHYLQIQDMIPRKVTYFWEDVVCKYWPWLMKNDPLSASKMKPALSVMHGKAHSWSCQVHRSFINFISHCVSLIYLFTVGYYRSWYKTWNQKCAYCAFLFHLCCSLLFLHWLHNLHCGFNLILMEEAFQIIVCDLNSVSGSYFLWHLLFKGKFIYFEEK